MSVWIWALVIAVVVAGSGIATWRHRGHLMALPSHLSRDAAASIAAISAIGVAIGAVFARKDGTTPTALAVGGMLLLGLVYLGPRLKSFKIKDVEIVLQDLAVKALDAEVAGDDEAAQQLRAEISRLVTQLVQPQAASPSRHFLSGARLDGLAAETEVAGLLQRAAPVGSEIWRHREGSALAADFGVVQGGGVVAVEVRLGLGFRPEDLVRLFKGTTTAAGTGDLALRGAILFVPEGRANATNHMQVRIQRLLKSPMHILEINDEVVDDLAEILAAMLGSS